MLKVQTPGSSVTDPYPQVNPCNSVYEARNPQEAQASLKKKTERSLSYVPRPFHYGDPRGSKTVYAYTEEEWGIGASAGGGDHNLIRSFYFSLVMTVLLFLPATLGCLFLAVITLFKLPVMALVMLFFALVFGLVVVQGYFNVTQEWRGRKARKLKGLPKPWVRVHDDHAYECFLQHPANIHGGAGEVDVRRQIIR